MTKMHATYAPVLIVKIPPDFPSPNRVEVNSRGYVPEEEGSPSQGLKTDFRGGGDFPVYSAPAAKVGNITVETFVPVEERPTRYRPSEGAPTGTIVGPEERPYVTAHAGGVSAISEILARIGGKSLDEAIGQLADDVPHDYAKSGYATRLDEISDMARVGRSYMEKLGEIQNSDGPLSGIAYSNDPAEVLIEIANRFEDADSTRAALEAQLLEMSSRQAEAIYAAPVAQPSPEAEILIVARHDLMAEVEKVGAKLRGWRAIDPDGVKGVADDATLLLDRLAAYMKGQDGRLIDAGNAIDTLNNALRFAQQRQATWKERAEEVTADRDEWVKVANKRLIYSEDRRRAAWKAVREALYTEKTNTEIVDVVANALGLRKAEA